MPLSGQPFKVLIPTTQSFDKRDFNLSDSTSSRTSIWHVHIYHQMLIFFKAIHEFMHNCVAQDKREVSRLDTAKTKKASSYKSQRIIPAATTAAANKIPTFLLVLPELVLSAAASLPLPLLGVSGHT